MSTERWGRTGRVEITPTIWDDESRRLLVDRERHGMVDRGASGAWYAVIHLAYTNAPVRSPDLPTRDAAIMWVLRRTVPDVWRAERPVVWRAWPGTYRTVPAAMRVAKLYATAEYRARMKAR